MNRKILLDEKDIPRQWYNLAADLPNPPLPPVTPDGTPIGPEMLAPVFPMNLIEQEVSTERWIDIPEKFWIFSIAGGLHRCGERSIWNAIWIRPQRFTIKMKAPVLPVATSPILLLRRHGTISSLVSNG
jgi:hypothetical protein